jgi:hypothetical protein
MIVASVGLVVTTTVPLFSARLPASSRAEKVTVVVPTGKDSGALFVTVTLLSTRSVAFALARKAAIRASLLGTADVEVSSSVAGAFSTGGVLSTTWTWALPAPVFPLESVALHVTVDVPIGNVDPEAGEQVAFGEMFPSTSSTAVTE